MEKKLSTIFGCLIGGMWMGEILLGNLGGTSVFGNLREAHPRVYALAGWFALGAVCVTGISGLLAAYRTGRISAALRVGVWSGLLSGGMVFVTGMGMAILFHGALMRDPLNIHEFARTAHRAPTEAELSSFIYWDMLGGAFESPLDWALSRTNSRGDWRYHWQVVAAVRSPGAYPSQPGQLRIVCLVPCPEAARHTPHPASSRTSSARRSGAVIASPIRARAVAARAAGAEAECLTQ